MKYLLSLTFVLIVLQASASSIHAAGASRPSNTSTLLAQATELSPTPIPPTPIPTVVNPDLALLPTGFSPNLTALLTSLLSVVIALVALLVFFYLLWGGFNWITSGGDKGKTETARNKIMAAVVGLIIVASSYAILQLLVLLLGYPSLTAVFEGIVPISGTGTVVMPTPIPPTSTPAPAS